MNGRRRVDKRHILSLRFVVKSGLVDVNGKTINILSTTRIVLQSLEMWDLIDDAIRERDVDQATNEHTSNHASLPSAQKPPQPHESLIQSQKTCCHAQKSKSHRETRKHRKASLTPEALFGAAIGNIIC